MKNSVLKSAPSCARVLPLVFAVAAVSHANAEGFIDDSHAKIEARNVYFNQDNRCGPAQPSKLEEWGQGFILNFTSGYTQGPVGFGVDALGMLGIRLDSGRGTHGNPNSVSQGGFVFPTDSDGRDFAGGFLSPAGQGVYFVGDHRKAAALFPGTCGFDGSVER
jgi:hypothetical protein